MAKESERDRRGAARTVALTEELGAQLRRMRGAGPKITQFFSMIQLEGTPHGVAPTRPLGTLPEDRLPIPLRRLRGVIEEDLDDRLGDVFGAFEEQPFALASLGQVHRAITRDGEHVAVKVQHPGAAEAIAGDLRTFGLVSPIVKRVAPGLDAKAVLAEARERIVDELDYEIEAQHHRRVARLFQGHPHVHVPRVHTDLSTRRVLVTEYVDGLGFDKIARLDEERDRIGEIVFRFFFSLLRRERTVAGDPHPDNCLLCPDGRVCITDFGLLRGLDAEYVEGERSVMRAIVDADPDAVHDALARLGYLDESQSYDPAALLEHLATAGEWLLADKGFRRIDPAYVRRTFELGYPPRSPWYPTLRRMSLYPPALLLRRMEVQLLSLLGELRAGGDWAAIAAEHWANRPASTPLGREDAAFFDRRSS